MRALWGETNTIVSITNGLLSLKKETVLGCVDSIVSLTFAQTNDIAKSIFETVVALRASKDRFDEAAKAPMAEVVGEYYLERQIKRFVEVQRSNCVGNIAWR